MNKTSLAQLIGEIVNEKIECNNCDWSWNKVDGGDDLYICHKCNHDNTPQALENFQSNDVGELESLLNKWSAYSGQYDLLPAIAKLAKKLGVNNGPSKVYRAVPGLDEYPHSEQQVIDFDKEQGIVATTHTRKQAEYFITDTADWAYILEYEPHIVINFDEFEKKYDWSGNWGEGEILIDVTKSKLINIEDYTKPTLENFKDGKKKGKSRPGRVKKSGASCKGSVTDLRAKAKKYGGEKGKMYHWCANMKSGKK